MIILKNKNKTIKILIIENKDNEREKNIYLYNISIYNLTFIFKI